MEENEVVQEQEQVTEQTQESTTETSEEQSTTSDVPFHVRVMIYVGMVLSVVFIYFAYKAMIPTDHSPSSVLENPEEHSILFK